MNRYKLILIAVALVLILPPFFLEHGADRSWKGLRAKEQALFNNGHYVQAEPAAKQTLEFVERTASKGHTDLAVALTDLGDVKLMLGKYAEAESLYARALEITKSESIAAENVYVANAAGRLGMALAAQGTFPRAESLFKQALSIDEKVYGAVNAHVAIDLRDLGRFYADWGYYAKAEPLLLRALDIMERVGIQYGAPREKMDYASTIDQLVELYMRQGKIEQTEQMLNKIAELMTSAERNDHPMMIDILIHQAVLSRFKGQDEQAQMQLRHAIALQEKAYGKAHPGMFSCLSGLAQLYLGQKQYAKAEPLYQQAMALAEHIHGPQSPQLAQAEQNLADLYALQGRYAQAQALYMRALGLREKAFGATSDHVIATLESMLRLYQKTGQKEQARQAQARLKELQHQQAQRREPGEDAA